MGGGLLTAIEENLSPVLICSETIETEILVVQVKAGIQKIRIINGYGPQENETSEKILAFWQDLEQAINKCKR